MADNSKEIEELKRRLKAAEDAIEQLKEEDLANAKAITEALCTMDYNQALHFFKGEELTSYIELWKGKVVAAMEQLAASETPKSVFEIYRKFDDKLGKYIKATKVATADKAMEIAHTFIKKYSPVALPMKAAKEGDVWLVDIDVGALVVKIAKVKVDARTGDILSYEIPEK